MNLVMTMAGKIHRPECKRLRRPYRVFFVLGDLDIGGFLAAQNFAPCGTCLREFYEVRA